MTSENQSPDKLVTNAIIAQEPPIQPTPAEALELPSILQNTDALEALLKKVAGQLN